jgi:hypothetical protein
VDNQWHWRSTFGNNNAVLTSSEIDPENAPLLKTQMIAGQTGYYDIWVNFWANPDEDWRIKAGLNSQNLQFFRQMACQQVDSNAHTTTLELSGGGNTFLYQAYLGRVEQEIGDTLEVFIDDEPIQTGTVNTVIGSWCRTWYDGISYICTPSQSEICCPESIDNPPQFILKQNYPNPFNSSTSIEYSLSIPAHVTLSVFNIRGQKIATLIDEKMSVGNHRTIWNAKDAPSGMYFLRIQTGKNSEMKKMLLVR